MFPKMPQQAVFDDDGGGNNGPLTLELSGIDTALNYLTSNGVKRNDAELLIKKFGTIPQHLSLAIGYLRENRMEKVSDLVLVEKTIVEIALDQLVKSGNSEGWILLQHLAWLDSEFISEELLLATLDNDQDKLYKAIKALQKLAFVSVVNLDGRKDLTIYREIQDQVVNYAANNPDISKAVPQVLEDISRSLNKLLPRIESNTAKEWEVAMAYVSTVKAMFEHAASRGIPLPENQEIALLNAKLGMIYERAFADIEKSLHHKEIALVIYKSIYEEAHPDVAWSLDAVGIAYETLGYLEKGVAYQEQALAIRQVLYIGNHLDIAESLLNVGIAYHKYENVNKALGYYERAVAMYQALSEENNHNMAVSLNAMGLAYQSLGDVRKGIDCYERAIAIYQVSHEGNHLDLARSLSNMGVALEALGNVKEALIYSKRAFKMYHALYEGAHLDIARSASKVGSTYDTLGDAENGLVYHKQALKTYQALYEGNHPDIAKALNNVGSAYETLGNIENGLNYFKRAIEMYQALGVTENAMATSLSNIGFSYGALGQPSKGIVCQESALTVILSLYKENHPAVAQSFSYVGLAYADLCDIGKCDLYKKCSFLYDDFIKKRGVTTEGFIIVKQKIQEEILNPIQWLAAKGEWSKKYSSFYDWGVVGYLDKNYLKKRLHQHQLNHAQAFTIALSLCFEAITIGIANSEEQDHSCAIAFARAYPELVSEIVVEHPEYFSLESIARACLRDAEYLLIVEPATLKLAQEEKEDVFKGNGMLAHASASYYEYYNTALDKLLRLRMEAVGLQIKRLDSWYLGGDMDSVSGIVSKVTYEFSNAVELVLAPSNLQGKHWVGLVFIKQASEVEVIYMDPEQIAISPQLKLALEYSLSINGYTSRFFELRLERQSYNNCGPEVIENFVYYLTGIRTTQKGALYLHSLLDENSLLDPKEYWLKIEENNKLIRFLSNAEPIDIQEITLFAEQRGKEAFESLNERTVPNDGIAKLKTDLYRASILFKALDFVVDSARLVQEPTILLLKKLVLDYAQLKAMVSGVNSYFVVISGAEAMYQLKLGEYQKAFNVASSTISAMALPVILAMVNRPYLGLAYGAWMTASMAYGAITNAYSFALELGSADAILKSTMAYKDLAEWLDASPLQSLHDFRAKVKEYKLQINDLLFETQKSIVKAQIKDEFSQKLFEHIYLPELIEKYALLNYAIRGDLKEEEAQSLKSKPLAISYGAREYDRCVRTEDFTRTEETAEHYYCCNIGDQILDHVVLTSSGSLEILESL